MIRFWSEYGAAFDLISEDDTVRVVVLSSALEKTFSAGVDRACRISPLLLSTSQNLPLLPTNESTCAVSDLHALPKHTDTGRRALLTRAHLRTFQNAIDAPARIPQPVIAAVHGTALGLALDMLCAVDVRWAASDAVFSIKEVDVGLAADTGTLARMPKLVANASLVRELALSARTFGAEEAQRSLGFVSRVVPGSRAEVVRAAIIEFAEVVARKSPIAVVGTKRFITHALDHSCVVFVFHPSVTHDVIFLISVWMMHLSIRRRGGRLLFRVRYVVYSSSLG